MAVAFRAVGNSGNLVIGAGAITPALPPGIVTDDILLLYLETSNQAIAVADAAGGTWTEVPDSPQGQGDPGVAGGVRLTVFWSRYNGTQTAPVTSDSGEHNAGIILAYSGCITSGDPYDVTAGDVQAATTAGSIPGDTTTVDGCMIVAASATDRDNAGPANAGSWANASLASITERADTISATGTGGGFAIADGIKTTAGVVSATTWTQAASAALCNLMVALKPPLASAVVTPATVATAATFPTPTLSAASNILASVLLVAASLATPAVTIDATVTPAAVTTTVTIPTPTLIAGANITPATVATLAIPPTPSIVVPTILRDSFVERATFTTTSPATSSHTPVGVPRSVTVFIAHGDVSTDLITGPVTYGGVAMTRVPTNGFAQDTAGEPGAVYAYHLGAGIPSGTRTLSITHSGTSTVKWAIVVYHTAAADTEIVTSGMLQGDQANPQLALDTGVEFALRVCVLFSGANQVTGINVLSGMEAAGLSSAIDFGTTVALMGQQSNATAGSFTVGFTASSDDVAFIALAIQEVAGGASSVPDTVTAAVTIPDPTVAIPGDVAPATVTATTTLPDPSFTIAANVFPATVASTATLPTPPIVASAKATPAVVARTVILPTPTVVGGTSATVTPATIGGDYFDMYGDPYSGGLAVTIPTPTIHAVTVITTATVATTVTLPTPTITIAVTVNPAAVAAVVTIPTPTVVGGSSTTVTPTTVSILSTVPDPVAATGSTIIPTTVAAVVTLPTATIQAGSTVTSATVPVVAALPTPTVTAESTVTPIVIPLTVTIPTPGVLVGVGALVLPDTVTVVATLPTPLVSTPVSVTPATVLTVVTIPTPTVVGGVAGSVTPAVVVVTATLPTPTLSAEAVVSPAVFVVVATLPTPVAGVDAAVTPATITATVDLPAPEALAAVHVSPAPITALVAVPTPTIQGEITTQPATLNVLATLPTPNVVVGAIFPPGFWHPDPVGYVKDPVSFVKIGQDDTPPW